MPEVVEPYVELPGTPQQGLEVAGHEVCVVGVSAEGVWKEEDAIVPGAVHSSPLRVPELPALRSAPTAEWGRCTLFRLLLVLGGASVAGAPFGRPLGIMRRGCTSLP